jgi:hypothetical protein
LGRKANICEMFSLNPEVKHLASWVREKERGRGDGGEGRGEW